MKTPQLSPIAMSKSGYKRSLIPLSHDVNTTCGFGEVQPLMCRAMFSDSKAVVDMESLVRLAPMLAPTFGDIKFKVYHEFVAMSDLTSNFNALLSSTRVNRGSQSFVPQFLPHIPLSLLSVACLIGAHCTIYRCNSSGSPVWHTYQPTQIDDSSPAMSSVLEQMASELGHPIDELFKVTNWNGTAFEGANRCGGLNYSLLAPDFDASYIGSRFVPLKNVGLQSYGFATDSTGEIYVKPVLPESADIVVERKLGNYRYLFAFSLSSFGKRVRKAIIGTGNQINFNSRKSVSLMPLFAYFRAWYELFGLQLFQNFEDTACNKLLQLYDNHNFYDYTWRAQAERMDDLFKFFLELGSMWFTDPADFVSAHTANITSSNKPFDLNTFIDVNGASSDDFGLSSYNVYSPNAEITEDSKGKNVHLRTITQNHGQLDSELLKRMYKWTNRNSILGQKVKELLIAQGLQDYVDTCEPRFIGYDETTIQISDVVSTADTESDGRGAMLGQYGGRGLQYKRSKHLTFETREYGYWITLAVVAPLSGYCQSLDMNNVCIRKEDFYNPEFDGLGYEANPKLAVVAAQDVNSIESQALSTDATKSLDANFGFVPKYSSLKVAANVMNGDFNLRSTRNSYMPYTLDKIINVGDKRYRAIFSVDNKGLAVTTGELFEPVDMPIAGNVWRFNGRYPFLSNYNRMFANQGSYDESLSRQFDLSYELTDTMLDNFLVHNAIKMDWYAPVLPLSDSFETKDDGNSGPVGMKADKA